MTSISATEIKTGKRRKRMAVVTGSRAEYGLLYWLMCGIRDDPRFFLHVIVTGMHLSPEFGMTYRQIESDGFALDEKVEILLSSDTPVGIAKSVGLAVSGLAEAFNRVKPDAVVLLGDRFETFAAAMAASLSRVPIVHIHGGELTEGAYDDAFRHGITKMSHLHFTATESYRNRVIQLGERPEYVFNVGALGTESIRRMRLLEREALEDLIGFKLGGCSLLVTFHPITLEQDAAAAQLKALLSALDEIPEVRIIFTLPNADTEGRILIQLIDQYVEKRSSRCRAYASLGQHCYLSAIKYVQAVVGNSSSGLIEAPLLGTPTLNIGDRQRGRLMPSSVVCCEATLDAITEGLRSVLHEDAQERARSVINPYGDGHSSERIIEKLVDIEFADLLKKRFYDIPIPVADAAGPREADSNRTARAFSDE